MDCSPSRSSVHAIFQARVLEWVAMPVCRSSSWPRDWIHVSGISCIAGGFFACWAIQETYIYIDLLPFPFLLFEKLNPTALRWITLNHFYGEFLPGFLWPVILLSLVLNLYLVYININVLSSVHSRWVLVKMPKSRLASLHWGDASCLFDLQGAFLCLLFISHSVVLDSLRPHGMQHARLHCPSPSSGVCSNSCPLSWWCHPTISPSVIPFSSCVQSFPASGSFPMSQLFAECIQVLEF